MSSPTWSPVELSPLNVVAVAPGRLRLQADWLRRSPARAVAAEEALDRLDGVRLARAYPVTGNVVVHFDPATLPVEQMAAAVASSARVAHDAEPSRTPRSADVGNGEVARIAVGGAALALLGLRRYAFGRPALLGPTSRLVATGVTIFSGYPFLKGAFGSLVGKRSAGTDALVSAATVASLLLRENVVALTVLWLLNIGEYLQDLTLRRTRRAIADLLQGSETTAWVRRNTRDSSGAEEVVEQRVDLAELRVGDLVVVHDQSTVPVDGLVVDGEAVVDQAALTGRTSPSSAPSVTPCWPAASTCAGVSSSGPPRRVRTPRWDGSSPASRTPRPTVPPCRPWATRSAASSSPPPSGWPWRRWCSPVTCGGP